MKLTSKSGHIRKTLAAGIVAALGSHAADAAVFNVTNNNDAGAGSLRDALLQANGNMEADTIDLSAISGQTISLTSGVLQTFYDDVTINGAGVTIDAGGNSGVLYAYFSDVTINELTITGGSSTYGGGIQGKYGALTLNDSVVTGNSAEIGGGIFASSYSGDISFNRSQITGNTAYTGGGLYVISYNDDVNLIDSVISGNSADEDAAPDSPPRTSRLAARLDERFPGWRDSRGVGLLGGGPVAGGGIARTYYGDVRISGTTIAGNSSDGEIGGLGAISGLGDVSIETSTFSANQAADGLGGGVAVGKYEVLLRNSTISGNSSDGDGGGFAAYAIFSYGGGKGTTGKGGNGVLALEFLTVTNNSSATAGGGLSLYSYGSLDIVASTIAGNTAPVDPDINFIEPAQTADVAFSLIGVDPSTGTLNKDAVSTALTGQNPLLGPLADNGGPTLTHLPAGASPLIDVIPPGDAGCGTTITVDQRGEARPTGPGCDIGALELTGTPPPVIPEATAVPMFDRIGLAIMAGLVGLLGLFGLRRRL